MRALTLAGQLQITARPHPPSLAGEFHLDAETGAPIAASRLVVPVVVGGLLALPGALALVSGLLKIYLGWPFLYDALTTGGIFAALAAVSLFVGAPLALLLNILPVLSWGLERRADGVSTSITFRPTLFHLAVLAVALLVAGVFFGHLAADAFACFRGIQSAC